MEFDLKLALFSVTVVMTVILSFGIIAITA
ncbi:YnhF family membrane protein [Photobacterium chitinilyticum]|uniref:YnhF family membrane protein n=1 Tax=Photobacterium chitinilyticum TaxID=2485123 RepID=A0A444JWR4_9GAMM|nr:YnhF family membrane protein [Photobacterium chitinilyticum]